MTFLTDNQILRLSFDGIYIMEINTKQLKNSLRKVMGLNDDLCGKSSFHLEGKPIWESCFIAIKQKTIFYFALWGECGEENNLPQSPQHTATLHWEREEP